MSGKIHFEVTGSNDDFKRAMQEVRDEIRNTEKSVDDIRGRLSGAVSDRDFEGLKGAISEGRSELESLQVWINKVGDAIKELPDGSVEQRAAAEVLERLKSKYAELGSMLGHAEKAMSLFHGSLVKAAIASGAAAALFAGLVIAVRAVTRECRETRKAIEGGFSAVQGEAAQQLAAFMKAQALWQSAGGDVEKLKVILRDYKKELNESGIAIKNINDGNAAFINNADAVVDAVKKRAVALAFERAALQLTDKAAAEYLKAEEKIAKSENRRETNMFTQIANTLSFGRRYNGQATKAEERFYELKYSKIRDRFGEKGDFYLDIAKRMSEAGVKAMQEMEAELNALGLRTTEQSEKQKKYAAELKKTIRRLEQYAAALSALDRLRENNAIIEERQGRNVQSQVAQARIDAMEEGYAKVEAQRQLNEKKELQAIYDAKQDYVRAYKDRARAEFEAQENANRMKDQNYRVRQFDASALNVDTSVFDRLIDAVLMKQKRGRQQSYEEMLREFETYKQAEIRINKEYDQKIARMKPGDTENIDRANKLRRKELSSLRAQELAETDVWKTLLGDLSLTSTELIRSYVETAKELLDNAEGLTSEDIKNFKEAIFNAQDEIIRRNPFKSLREAYEKYQKATADKDKIAAARQMSLAVTESGTQLQGIVDSLSQVASLFGGGGENLAGVFQNISSIVGTASSAISAFSLAKAGKGSYGVAAAGALSFLASVGSLFKDLSEYLNAEDDRSYSERLDYLNQIELSLARLKAENYETVFGTKSIEATTSAYRKMSEALDLYRRTYSESGKVFGAYFDYSRVLKEAGAKKSGGDLRDMVVRTYKSLLGFRDRYARLGDLAPELWENGELNIEAAKVFLQTNTQITEEQRKQIQLLIEQKEAYEDASRAVDDMIGGVFGNLGADIADIIWDSVMSGADAWDAFRTRGGEAITAIGKQLLQEMVISEYLEQFRDRMRAAYGLGDATATQAALRDIVGNIFGGMQTMLDAGSVVAQEYKDWAAAHGFDLSDTTGTSRRSVAKAMTSVSQDSWDVVDGKITNMMMRLNDINDTFGAVRDVQLRMLEQVGAIAVHTARLERMDANMAAMRSEMEAINTRGVSLRQI